MNILLVDDEIDVLDGIIAGVDFESIGIHNAYTASSVSGAKKLMESYPIDIMITDIEMPGESGIALLEWIQRNELPIVSILCTAYAHFDYARKALENKAFNYYLKPIYYEDLTKIIASAVQEANLRKLQSDSIEYGRCWGHFREQIRNLFWKELILGIASGRTADIAYLEDTYQVSYPQDELFSVILIDVLQQEKRADGVVLVEEAVYALGKAGATGLEAVFSPRSSVIYVICRAEEPAGFLRQVIAHCRDTLHMEINCYYLPSVPCAAIPKAFRRAENIYRDDFSLVNRIIQVSKYQHQNGSYSNPRLKEWEHLFCQNQLPAICREAEQLLRNEVFSSHGRYADRKAFRMDILQLLNVVLYKHEIRSGELFSQLRESEIYEHSERSTEDMMRFVSYALNMASRCIAQANNISDTINIALKYIDDNISGELSRESISKLLYLNPDYFSRLFKKRMGCSVGTYIRNRKLELAKEYLLYSNKSVGMIAFDVGYESMSYFSQIFKKYVGVTPKEFRMHRSASPDFSGKADTEYDS